MNAYGRLIQRVKKVDRIAALRLARVLPLLAVQGKLKDGHSSNGFCPLGYSDLRGAFMWRLTSQGRTYWRNIHEKLEEGY